MKTAQLHTCFALRFKQCSECGFPGENEKYQDLGKWENIFFGIENHLGWKTRAAELCTDR